MKVCSRKQCKHEGKKQGSDQFYKNPQLRDGLDSWCKTCVKENRDKKQMQKLETNWLKIIIG